MNSSIDLPLVVAPSGKRIIGLALPSTASFWRSIINSKTLRFESFASLFTKTQSSSLQKIPIPGKFNVSILARKLGSGLVRTSWHKISAVD